MNSKSIARMAGWAGLAAVVTFIAGFITQATPLIVVSSVLGVPFFYGMYDAHRAGNPSQARAGMALGMLGSAMGLIAPTPLYDSLFVVSAVALGLGIAVFGYLGLSTSAVPRGLAVAGLVAGMLQILFGITPDLGGDLLGMVLVLVSIIWQVWFSSLFLGGRLLPA